MAEYEMKSIGVNEVPQQQQEEDARQLHNLGYKQQLNVSDHPDAR